MSIISNTVAPQSSIVAQSQSQTSARTESGNSANPGAAASNSAVAGTQSAAVVSLATGSSQNRAPGRGEARSVDAAFEKQDSKSSTAKADAQDKLSPGSLVNVEA